MKRFPIANPAMKLKIKEISIYLIPTITIYKLITFCLPKNIPVLPMDLVLDPCPMFF
jgi:hypothetical protein